MHSPQLPIQVVHIHGRVFSYALPVNEMPEKKRKISILNIFPDS